VQQVGAQDTSATLASVDAHLDMLRPAISNYGGSVVVRSSLFCQHSSPVLLGVHQRCIAACIWACWRTVWEHCS
jgi:hypothetical protein